MTPSGAGARRWRLVLMAGVRWYNASAAYAVELAAALRERGHDVLLVVKPGSPVESRARALSLPLETGFDLTARAPRPAAANLRALRRTLAAFRPDLVNAHRSEDHLFAALALRGSGIPLVRTRGDVRTPRRHLANRALYRRATAAHVACADFMPERFFAPLGIPPERIRVIRPGLDPGFAAAAPSPPEARRRLGLDTGGPWVGQIGRFTAAKGHSVLLEAMARLGSTTPPKLLLSGRENEIRGSDLLATARAFGLGDRVRIVPPADDVRPLLRALDVLVVPSVASEAIARIALEGLALGVPTVASRLNSLPEIVGDAGLLVPPGDPDALAGAVRRFLTEPPLAERARSEGPARIERRYARATQITLTEDLFGSLIPGGAG